MGLIVEPPVSCPVAQIAAGQGRSLHSGWPFVWMVLRHCVSREVSSSPDRSLRSPIGARVPTTLDFSRGHLPNLR
jgi:hypothetical protein